MKRVVSFLIFVFPFSVAVYSQVSFAGISWVRWEDEPDELNPGYVNNPIETPVIRSYFLDPELDIEDVGSISQFNQLWDMISEEHYVSNIVQEGGGDPYDLGEQDEAYGASFKVFNNLERLHVLVKYRDRNSVAATRDLEVMTQPTSLDYHLPTFLAASDSAPDLITAYQNMAFARYIELGGANTYFSDGGIGQVAAQFGLAKQFTGYRNYFTGNWGMNEAAFNQVASLNHYWEVDGENTIHAILILPFDRALGRPADPMNLEGPYIPSQPGDTICFEVKSNARTSDDMRIDYTWASPVNNVYASNYYAGKLVLGNAPPPVVTSPIYYCRDEAADPLSATGTALKWYSESGGSPLPGPPTPSTGSAGSTTYFVTQTINGDESQPSEIEVIVYEPDIQLSDLTITCGNEASLTALFENYRGSETVSYSWSVDGSNYSGNHVTIQPTDTTHAYLEVTTPSGCYAADTATIDVLKLNARLPIKHVSVDLNSKKNLITWATPDLDAIDSIYVLSVASLGGSAVDTIARFKYSVVQNQFTDNRIDNNWSDYKYSILTRDICQAYSDSPTPDDFSRGVSLKEYTINDEGRALQWNSYQGRDVRDYELLKGSDETSLSPIFKEPDQFNFYDPSLEDSVVYRLKVNFFDDYPDPGDNSTYSNLVESGPSTPEPTIDTLIYYDTIPVVRYDTITVTVHDTVLVSDTIWTTETDYVSVTDTLVIRVNFTGAEDHPFSMIKIFPNPASDHVIITMEVKDHTRNYQIKIVDTRGATVFYGIMNQPEYRVNLEDFGDKGLYFVQILNDNGQIIDTRKIILE